MTLFHSKDDIDVTPTQPVGRKSKSPDSSPELSRFRRPHEPGILSLLYIRISLTVLPRNPIILIPSRLAATRLPGKPLADIAGTPMIVRVWRCAVAAEVGPVIVACGDRAIAEAVTAAGARAVMTDPGQPTGSDRIHEAIGRIDPDRHHDAVINVQGDLPMLDPAAIGIAVAGLADPDTDIATLAAPITDNAALHDTGVNKVVAGFTEPARPARALYFSKAIVPWGPGPYYEHIGLYAYRRAALERFVGLPRGILEQREHLEQLRALEAGMRISVSLIDPARLGVQVDTPADLARARRLLEGPQTDAGIT
ncbi:MAG: 3-deoxy-manno-octulosonate cytidylyltransferase [Alphaproteobacteria bacterium]|nr:3-deoxy-manno-octulosonate cytidylyltransferase [Alphaproteobacteria bacterium]